MVTSVSTLAPIAIETQQPSKPAPCGNAFGHVFKVIFDGISDAAKGVVEGAKKVVWAVFQIKEDPSALQQGIKLANFGLMGMGAVIGHHKFIGNFNKDSNIASDLIDALQIVSDADYFFNARFIDDIKDGRYMNILARIAFVISDVGTTILWAAELGILQLGKIVEVMGKVPVLNMIAKIPLSHVVNKATLVGYALWVADAFQRIIMKETFADKLQAILDLAQCGLEVTIRVFVIFGGTNPIVLITLGVTAAGFGAATFLYKTYQGQKKEENGIQVAAAA